jgi:protein-L-isoaspartate(D-aspartate) O-methyltransferase
MFGAAGCRVAIASLLALACQQRDREVSRPPPRPSLAGDASSGGAPAGAAVASPPAASAGDYERERERMVREQMIERDIVDPRVLAAMRRVPRHRFVLEHTLGRAYADTPLPIPAGQTISQPYIVAFMSQAASIREGARCLEIGTGSGYQGAVLTELCAETYSIEYLPEVAAFARRNLQSTGYLERRLFLRVGDGYAGWPDRAPFDAILVTAAPEAVPPPLLEQLAPGGHLVIPVGGARAQELEIYERIAPGDSPASFERRAVMGVRFVPFLGR